MPCLIGAITCVHFTPRLLQCRSIYRRRYTCCDPLLTCTDWLWAVEYCLWNTLVIGYCR